MKNQTHNKKSSFIEFLSKPTIYVPFVVALVTYLVRSVRKGTFEIDTFLVSLLALFCIFFAIWEASKIKKN